MSVCLFGVRFQRYYHGPVQTYSLGDSRCHMMTIPLSPSLNLFKYFILWNPLHTCSNVFTWEAHPGSIGKRVVGLQLKDLLVYNVNVLLINSLLDTQSKTVSKIFQGNWSSVRTCSYRIVIKYKQLLPWIEDMLSQRDVHTPKAHIDLRYIIFIETRW